MPRKSRPAKKTPPQFFPAGEDADLLDEDGDDPQPIVEFGRRSVPPPKEGTPDAAKKPRASGRRRTP